jgi:hypothetical protein
MIYGCFLNKMYSWECKAFEEEKDATNFCIQKNGLSMLVPVADILPKFIHERWIQYKIQKRFPVRIP